MRYVIDPCLSERRVAFAIARRLGTAVARNRLRRRLRALLAGRAAELPPGLYLIGARPAAVSAGFSRLTADMDVLLSRLSVRGRDGAPAR
jgi:ribonuclease P protein component